MKKILELLFLGLIIITTSCEIFEDTLENIGEECDKAESVIVTSNIQGDSTWDFCDGNKACFLNDAIATANFCGSEVTISLEENTTYLFEHPNEGNLTMRTIIPGRAALPTISGNIVIEGNGSTLDRSSNDYFRFFHIAKGGSLTLKNLTLTNGYADTKFTDSFANDSLETVAKRGGAIYCDGRLVLENCTIERNTSKNLGGSIFASNLSTLFIDGTTFKDNVSFEGALGTGGGGAIHTASETFQISKTVFFNNRAKAGGAMSIDSRGNNLTNGPALIKQCLFERNSATPGGAIHTTRSGTVNIGGIPSYSTDIAQSLVVENSTFAANSAIRVTSNSGRDSGGAFYCIYGYTYLTHCTIVDNTANPNISGDGFPEGGGFHFEFASASFKNCILSNPIGGDLGGNQAPYFSSSSTETNFVSDFTDTNPNILSGNPQLSTLTGTGYQRGYEPLAGSPLIDTAASVDCLTEDQKGNTRSVGGSCDLGAIEVQ